MSDYDDRDYDAIADAVYQEYLVEKEIDKLKNMYAELQTKYDTLRMQDMPKAINQLTEICQTQRTSSADLLAELNKIYMAYSKQTTTLRWLVGHSVAAGSISKAKGAELLGIPLIDYVNENFSESQD